MKKLQESLLDDEDTLMNDTGETAVVKTILKLLNNRIKGGIGPTSDFGYGQNTGRKSGEDMFGKTLNRGDIVLYSNRYTRSIEIYIIKEVFKSSDECRGIWDIDSFNADPNKTCSNVLDCIHTIKIDLNILKKIIK